MRAMIGAALLVASWGLLPRQAQQEPPPKAIVEDYTSFSIGPVPASFGYDPTFYKKHVDAHGIPVSREEHQAAAQTVTRTEETRGSETL
jgi:hypothetical protein